jgi:cytochrome c biogenesis protein CcmG/thiol:disulfide interchange protein DsbE
VTRVIESELPDMQNMRLKFLLPIAAFVALVVVFYNGLYEDPTRVPSPFIGKQVPAFELPSLQNPAEMVTEKTFAGQVSLFNVWASWCPGCAQEHALLTAVAAQHGVPVYGLNWKDERSAALKWLQRMGNPYKAVAYDRENIVGIDWGVYGAPETFLIDSKGVIQYKLIGPMTPDIWQQEFLPRIATAREELANGGEG